jgi:hypothetical protein
MDEQALGVACRVERPMIEETITLADIQELDAAVERCSSTGTLNTAHTEALGAFGDLLRANHGGEWAAWKALLRLARRALVVEPIVTKLRMFVNSQNREGGTSDELYFELFEMVRGAFPKQKSSVYTAEEQAADRESALAWDFEKGATR